MSNRDMGRGAVPSGPNRRWTDSEVRYLSSHREDGADLIAHVLGRTPKSVRNKASRLRVRLVRRELPVCPVCGAHHVRDSKAGRHGMCQVCWERRKAEAMRERAAELRAQSEYQAAKKRAQRAGRG